MSIQATVRNRVIAASAAVMIAAPALAQTQTIPRGPLMQAPVEQAATQAVPPVSPAAPTPAQIARDYVLGAGDIVRVTVFQNPDLTTETRVSEAGAITFPLIGNVQVGGLSLADAEKKIATLLRDGNYVKQPQVTLLVTQNQGNQVAVLGQVNKPGRYPLETTGVRLTDMIATAGGVAPSGGDIVVVTGVRDGKPFSRQIDVASMFLNGRTDDDVVLSSGDTIYVHRAPAFYIYGEVQHPGMLRLERGMTVMQALAAGGGVTPRGTTRGMQLHRKDTSGKVAVLQPKMNDTLQPDDILYVKESLF
ncbi:polysaccharide export protein EpsE [Uliginosibacterium sp. sgz301328]|uniref:polysaccharide export protein EpsE n=1 Tax=Uliginosibacterium sp. sgz301328 TaxID=3243764 RepID=UPI00359E684E